MSAKIYDTTQQAFVDAEVPKVNDGNAFVDSEGKSYNGSEWVEDWASFAKLIVGNAYTLGSGAYVTTISATNGVESPPKATCLAIQDKRALMQSWGITNDITYRTEGQVDLTEKTKALFGNLISAISNVRLPSGTSINDLRVYWNNTYDASYTSTVYNILWDAAKKIYSISPGFGAAWLAEHETAIDSNGLYRTNVGNNFVICPSFIIDLTKVKLNGTTIEII